MQTLKSIQNILASDEEDDEEHYSSTGGNNIANINPQIHFEDQLSDEDDFEENENEWEDVNDGMFLMLSLIHIPSPRDS